MIAAYGSIKFYASTPMHSQLNLSMLSPFHLETQKQKMLANLGVINFMSCFKVRAKQLLLLILLLTS